ncbi:MAG: cell division protein FtsZ [Bacteroidales bacterium]|jgi:cell division protein FtsZ|nr:cell division protein FtsZ [Bacteroidales bacterium]
MNDILAFDYPSQNVAIIKVVGVGGGGGNAVTHMFKEGIKDVTFMLCNTDNQALVSSNIPQKLQLGRSTTGGLGAGNNPKTAGEAAEESYEDIKSALSDGTRMVFITAGMGGGTGTGAAPIIAKAAREMELLTVGIVTIPFKWEGEPKINQALDGVEEMSQYVDALLVINNEQLSRIYPDLTVMNGFRKADDTLTVAAKSIAEIITVPGYINLDFADVRTILKDGGVAIMSTGFGKGDRRLGDALESALNSPLLNNNDVFNARKVLFNIACSTKQELMMFEMDQIHDFMKRFNNQVEVIWGITFDDNLDQDLKVTLLATGFNLMNVPQIQERTAHKTEEELAKERIKDEKRTIRLDTYYPDHKAKRRKRYLPYVLKLEEMDDDAVIASLENTPAYRRGMTIKDNHNV